MATNPTIPSLFILLLSAALPACNKVLDVPAPPGQIGVAAAFGDSTTAVAAVTGVYVQMAGHGQFEWSGISYNTARSADEVINRLGTDSFAENSLLYTNTGVRLMWQQGFTSLLQINTNISGLKASTGLSIALQHQLLGEMFFCRAFVNFYLVNLWGDAVPLVTSPNAAVNAFAKSENHEQLYTQIIADLLEAQHDLSISYPSAGRARPNVMAVDALLARVYLYQQRYNEAISLAGTVIGSNLYSPLPPLSGVFLATSREAIWQLLPPNFNGPDPVGEAYIYHYSPSGVTPELLAAFEPGDLRRQTWIGTNTSYSDTFKIPYKYKNGFFTNDSLPIEYYVVLRLAEQFLIRAEANARLGQTSASVADLNIIRIRAGLPALADTLTQAQCIAAVQQERRVELFSEWGHRWLDLKRWPGVTNPSLTRADEVLGAYKSGWQPTDRYYPVPQYELQVNPNLVQNPGYPNH
ncbi:MAG: RagB/SusD family nutrient uptake outer membrane protein [Bacteroidetes bacterium]|nr:RagB/SusD family nutrient uptake outer membrane protein [Bacteroidota bacterium]